MAKNIQEYVAKRALEYAYAREEEIKTLKRKYEVLFETIGGRMCIHCYTNYASEDPLISPGDCALCGIYRACQNCVDLPCRVCNRFTCPDCSIICFACTGVDNTRTCVECASGEVCFGCWFGREGQAFDGIPLGGCKDHSHRVRLSNGYEVPMCRACIDDFDVNSWTPSVNCMMTFFGMIHRNQKKAKAE